MEVIKEFGGKVMPLDSFIIHMVKLAEIFEENITKENVPTKIKEIREITNAMESTYNEIKSKSTTQPGGQAEANADCS